MQAGYIQEAVMGTPFSSHCFHLNTMLPCKNYCQDLNLVVQFLRWIQLFCRFIRCWDAKLYQEIYRITVGLGGLGSGPELCIWSLLALRSKLFLLSEKSLLPLAKQKKVLLSFLSFHTAYGNQFWFLDADPLSVVIAQVLFSFGTVNMERSSRPIHLTQVM